MRSASPQEKHEVAEPKAVEFVDVDFSRGASPESDASSKERAKDVGLELAKIFNQLQVLVHQQTDFLQTLARIEGFVRKQPEEHQDLQGALPRIKDHSQKKAVAPSDAERLGGAADRASSKLVPMQLKNETQTQNQVTAPNCLPVAVRSLSPLTPENEPETLHVYPEQSKLKPIWPASMSVSGDNGRVRSSILSHSTRRSSILSHSAGANTRRSTRSATPFQTLPLLSQADFKHLGEMDNRCEKGARLSVLSRSSRVSESNIKTSGSFRPSNSTSLFSTAYDEFQIAAALDEATSIEEQHETQALEHAGKEEYRNGAETSPFPRMGKLASGDSETSTGGEFCVHKSWLTKMTVQRGPSMMFRQTTTDWTPEHSASCTGEIQGASSMGVNRHPSRYGDQRIVSESEILESARWPSSPSAGFRLEARLFLLSPASFNRMAWDVLSALMMAYEAITTPFMLAFNPPVTEITQTLRVISVMFWLVDMIISFLTGYYSGGVLVMQHKRIAMHYLRTWFVLDIFVIALDVVTLCIDTPGGMGSGVGKVLRVVRIARALRLLRLLKLRRILDQMYDKINSQYVHVFSTVLVKLVTLLCLTHFVACGWFLVGSIGSHPNWVHAFVHEKAIPYQYTTSVHWAISQVHGSMEVSPTNTHERAFAIFVVLAALVYFSVFIAHLATLLGELVQQNSDQAHEFWLLRRYLKQMAISISCSSRILKYLEYVVEKKQRFISEESISMLGLLSKPLHDELKLEIYAEHLSKHIFFDFMYSCMRSGLMVTIDAFSTSLMSAGDLIFICGENAESMFFLTNGHCEYSYEVSMAKDGMSTTGHRQAVSIDAEDVQDNDMTSRILREEVTEGEWACEAALWVQGWVCHGDLVARSMCQFLFVNSDILRAAALTHASVAQTLRAWAVCFVKRLNIVETHELTDLLHLVISPHDVLADMGLKSKERYAEHHHATNLFLSLIEILSRQSGSLVGNSVSGGSARQFCRVAPDQGSP